MKRKIEDYINKGDYAILCSSIEEWNTIVDLINKNHVSTTTQPYSKTKSNVLNLQNLGVTIGTGTLKSFPSYIIYSASDFLEEEFKFEEGKWYYIELGVHKHYLKFKKINKNNAFLDKEGYIKNLKEWGYGCSINIKEVTFYRLLTDLSEIQQYLPPNHPDLIVKLTSFPLEGYVYDDVNNLDNLSKYLVNRPFNTPNNNTVKKNAVGIAWNTTSCWWLKTKTSGKTNYKLSDLESFLPKTEIIPEYVKLLPIFDNNNTDRIFYTKGAIPKMENLSYRSWKHLFEIHSTYFKESTKEAFDLQNKPKQLLIKKEKSLVKQVEKGLKLKDRWVKCVKECGWNTINVGEYIQILQNNNLVPYVKWRNNKKKYCIDLNRIDKGEFELMPEGFSPNEKEWIHNQYPLTPIESFQPSIYDLKDIYIAPIIKKETKIQTITIESTINLNLNLKTIKI